MSAATDGADCEADIKWTRRARLSFVELLAHFRSHEYGDPIARGREILAAVKRLRYAPARCQVMHIRRGTEFRRLIVSRRFFVYYIYFPPDTTRTRGVVSVRSVKHGAQRRPFAGVREPAPAEYVSAREGDRMKEAA